MLDAEKIRSYLHDFMGSTLSLIQNPLFWLQFAVAVAVFAIAHWFLSPLMRKGMARLSAKAAHVPTLRRPLLAVKQLSTPFVWLLLQWIALHIVRQLNWPDGALTTIVSLLGAWVLIRLVTTLVMSEFLANFITIAVWSVAALNIFGLLDAAVNLLDSWSLTFGGVRVSPVTVLKAAASLLIAWWFANALSDFIERHLDNSRNISPAMKVLGVKLTRLALMAGAILVSLASVGIDLTAFAVFSGALGVGLGFGLQKIFSNLVSGIILLMDRSIKPGDVITVNNTFGWINYLGARYVSVITRDGIEHLIPNEELITQRVENWTYSNSLVRLKIPIGISYNSDPGQAMALCVEAAKKVSRVQAVPSPLCQLISFGDSSVNLELRIWINDP